MNQTPNKPARTRRPTPALLVAVTALVAALGGSAVALPGKGKVDKNDLGKGVVKAKNIRTDAVTAAHIGVGQVGAPEIADGGVGAAEIADAQVRSAEIADGQVGAAELSDLPAPTPLALSDGGEGDCLWQNATDTPPADGGIPGLNRASFYVDPFGVVHLAGFLIAVGGPGGDKQCNPGADRSDRVAVTLPPAVRPVQAEVQGISDSLVLIAGNQEIAAGGTTVGPGEVADLNGEGGISLDGITYRTSGAGG
jgi:hypothetical protein